MYRVPANLFAVKNVHLPVRYKKGGFSGCLIIHFTAKPVKFSTAKDAKGRKDRNALRFLAAFAVDSSANRFAVLVM